MCYSAEVWEDYRNYCRVYGADITIGEFFELYVIRGELGGTAVKIPKGMDFAFLHPQSETEQRIKELIEQFNAQEIAKVEQDLFKQRKRLADAKRILQNKITKKAQDDERIATSKVEKGLARLADLKRTEPRTRDSRIFPGGYAPVMVMHEGRRTVLPMRYHCRPMGKPAAYDGKYPGTYNARRDSLDGYWKDLFGYSHGVMVVQRFYENVERIDDQGQPYNQVLEFVPQNGQDMLVACLWSRWRAPGQRDLLSFAAITDEPPAEVAAAGHDRCIIPIKPENLDAWLNPEGQTKDQLQAILEDRDRPYYEHRLAA